MQQNCLEKRGVIFFEMGKYDQAIKDLEACKSISSVHYLKGLIYYKLKKPMQAILSFEQCLKNDVNEENITSSVEMMMRIKIQEKDFYQAYHILNRTINIDINKDVIEQWRLFLQGTLFLMKKKYRDGLNTYKSLLSFPLQYFKLHGYHDRQT